MTIEFHKCCFCINLRTGCLIIGYLNLIGAIVMTVLTIVILALSVENLQSNYFYYSEYQNYNQESKRTLATMVPMIAALVVFLIHFLGFTIVLLVGLHQHKRGHVKAYLIYALIIIVLQITYSALLNMFSFLFGLHIIVIFTILLGIYFLLVIRSYYLKMDDPANNPAISNTA